MCALACLVRWPRQKKKKSPKKKKDAATAGLVRYSTLFVRLRGPGIICFVGREVQNVGAPLAWPVVHDPVPRRAPFRDLIVQAATAADCLDTVELLVCFFRLRPLCRCCVSF